ncbi:polysaccharide deacetylase family protein [Streptomyces mirabilis]|nr:polysaccharide deacetylase family protein [Streptomyces mirabilis]
MRTRALVAGALTAALLTNCTGCAQSVDPIERLGKKAAQEVRRSRPNGPTPATYRHWGCPPARRRAAATRPARPPRRGAGAGPVVDRVHTRDKVVFLTYDDGAERDPRFVDMVRELRLPVSMFLTDSVVGPGYGHFAQLRTVGASVQNHTLHHASLRGLPYAGQRAEICGQQEKLKARFGVRPRLFRPPYGTYDTTTLHAAADCGVAAVVLGREPDARRLRPGDILSGFEEPNLTEATIRLLRRIQAEGFTPARLENYL